MQRMPDTNPMPAMIPPPGTLLASLAIGVLVILMDLILTYSNPGAAYGVAGSVLILLWSLYMVSQIAVIGAIVNAVLGKRYDRRLIEALYRRPAAPARRARPGPSCSTCTTRASPTTGSATPRPSATSISR